MRAFVACLAVVAAIALPGVIVAARSSGRPTVFQQSTGITAVGRGTWHPVAPMSPATQRIADALSNTFGAQGIELHFLPIRKMTWEAFQSGSGRCLVDIAISGNTTPQPFFLSPECSERATRADRVGIVYSPPSIRPTVDQAVANLR